jgi:hypothetical protein
MMDEKRLTDILIPNDYERFANIVREMSENWIVRLSGLVLQGQLVDRVIMQRYPELLTDFIAGKIAELRESDTRFITIKQKLENILWLQHILGSGANQEVREYLHRECWKPYDEHAWDILFEQVVDAVLPALDVWLIARGHILAIHAAIPSDHPLHSKLPNLIEQGDRSARELEDRLNARFVKAQRIWRDAY